MKPFKWQCPYCNHHSTIKDDNFHTSNTRLTIENVEGNRALYSEFIVCPNPDCNKYTLSSYLFPTENEWNGARHIWNDGEMIKHWNLIPQSNAKVFPDYVPKPITDDYNEACLIVDLSPKASATLARRCLQGMIRDFWGIKKGRLIDEINALEDKIDSLTWDSIDATRKIGNIGAHMEKDINTIIEVDQGEAQVLIHLIEILIDEWYVNKNEREKKLKSIVSIGKSKTEAKKKK